MKPLLLEFTAFGPYPGKVSIDFRKINGMFLISGNTGAGKTTILDAMTYAIYGKLSGEDRPEGSIRCATADKKMHTTVTLEFEHGGKNYTVKRDPRLDIASKSGTADLVGSDGINVSGKTKVDKALLDMLKISIDKWRLIVTIPQGKFADLIRADSNQQAEIIRDIFGTERYGRYTAELKTRSDAASKEEEKAAQDILSEVTHLETDDGTDLSGLISRYSQSPDPVTATDLLEEVIALLSEQNKADAAMAAESDDSITALKNAKDKADKEYNDAETLAGLYRTLGQLKDMQAVLEGLKSSYEGSRNQNEKGWSALTVVSPLEKRLEKIDKDIEDLRTALDGHEAEMKSLESEKSEAADALEKAAAARRELDPVVSEISVRESKLEDYDKLEEAVRNEEEARRQFDSAKTDKEKASEEKGHLQAELDEIESFLAAHKGCKETHSELLHKIKESEQRLDGLRKLKKACVELGKKRSLLESVQMDYDKAFIENQAAKENYSHTSDRFFGSHLGILARDLNEGQQCPLCGSTHHPLKASMPAQSATETELKAAKEKSESAEKTLRDLFGQLESIRSAAEATKNDIMERASELGFEPDFGNGCEKQTESLVKNENAQHSALEKEKKSLTEILDLYSSKEKRRDEISPLLDAATASINGLSEKLLEAGTRFSAASETLKNLKGSLEFESKEDAVRYIEGLKVRVASADNTVTISKESFDKTVNGISTLDGSIKTTKAGLADKEAERTKAASELAKAIKDEGFGTFDEYKAALKEKSELERIDKEIREYDQKVASNMELIRTKTDEIGRRPEPADIQTLKSASEEAGKAYDESLKSSQSFKDRLGRNKGSEEVLCRLRTSFGRKHAKSQMLTEMYNVAAGKVSGSSKVSYDEYVQYKYFHTILENANRRLEKMTGGRYSLCTHRESGYDIKDDLLALYVFDNENGGYRSVKSLSGGESFQAALSLALGLSDIIHDYSCRNAVDALFIDEGFGTLDRNSLKEAVNTLASISGNTGKCIGIISHREELKEVIPKRLDVIHEEGGSYIDNIF